MRNVGLTLAGGAAGVVAACCIGTLLIARSMAIRQIPPRHSFRLKVNTIKDTAASRSYELTLTAAGTMNDPNSMETQLPVAVEVEGGCWSMTRISPDARTGLCTAVIPLSADLAETPQHGRNINLSIYVNGMNGRSGGSGTYSIKDETLPEVFSLTAKSGDYPIDSPMTIGSIQGRSIRLLAGDSAMNKERMLSGQNPSTQSIKGQAVRSGK